MRVRVCVFQAFKIKNGKPKSLGFLGGLPLRLSLRRAKALMEAFQQGYVEKEELAAALREQKAAVEETKSAQRVEAEEFYRKISR